MRRANMVVLRVFCGSDASPRFVQQQAETIRLSCGKSQEVKVLPILSTAL